MNKVWITGRLTKEPELKKVKENSLCSFDLAVNSPVVRDGKQQTDFINCVVWNKQAEILCNYQHKGNLIGVVGELRVDKYTIDNQAKTKTYVSVNNIEFLEKNSTKQNEDNIDKISVKTDFDIGQQDEDLPTNKLTTKTETQTQFEYSESDLPW